MNPFITPPKVIFFDLDDTLFDRDHSWKCGFAALSHKIPKVKLGEVVFWYKEAMVRTRRLTKDKSLTPMEINTATMTELSHLLGLETPGASEANEMYDIFKAASHKARRATHRSIDTLIRLRENGYRIGIITNGSIEVQVGKVEAIGIRQFVDHIVTSEEAACSKPAKAIFQNAIERFNAPLYTTCMVGDSITNDIKGAQNAKLRPILYVPPGYRPERPVDVPIIYDISRVLSILGISTKNCRYDNLVCKPRLIIKDLRIDVPIVPRHRLWTPTQTVFYLMNQMAKVIHCALDQKSHVAINCLKNMVKVLHQSKLPIGEASSKALSNLTIEALNGETEYQVIERDLSICVELKISSEVGDRNPYIFIRLAGALQGFCNGLMEDNPQVAMSDLEETVNYVTNMAKGIDGIDKIGM